MNEEINKQFNETIDILSDIDEVSAIEYATWTKDKANMKFKKDIPSFPITSNYIYWCNLGINIGSEQNKIRPVCFSRIINSSPPALPIISDALNCCFRPCPISRSTSSPNACPIVSLIFLKLSISSTNKRLCEFGFSSKYSLIFLSVVTLLYSPVS